MREDIDRQEYIDTVLAQISDKTAREEIKRELSAHIDDREDYYRQIGYDSNAAAEKALERMGSPELTAEGLSRVHNGKASIAIILFSIATVIYVFSFLLSSLRSINYSLFDTYNCEMQLLAHIFVLTLLGKKQNSRFACSVALGAFSIAYGGYALIAGASQYGFGAFYSKSILKIVCLLTGDLDAVAAAKRVFGVTVVPWLTYLSAAVYALIFILLILALISVYTVKRPYYSLRTKHFSKHMYTAARISMCLFIAAGITALIAELKINDAVKNTDDLPYDTAVIAQSNSPCPVSEIPEEDIVEIGAYYNDSLDPKPTNIPLVITDEFISVPLGDKLNYQVKKSNITCNITKEYVYIEFRDTSVSKDRFSNSPENWYKSESAGSILSDVGSYTQLEVTVSKNSP